VTIFARVLPSPARRSPANARGRILGLALLSVLAALLTIAPSAGAVVTPVGGTTVGLQPRTEVLGEGSPETFANESGNAILSATSVYAVFWDPTDVFHHHHEWLTKIDHFFQQMGAASGDTSTVFGPLAQYRDRANSQAAYSTVFKGSYSDTTKYPAGECTDPEPLFTGAKTCLTDAQLREQLQSFIAGHSLPKGMNTVYYVVTPPGVTVCIDAGATHCSDYKVSAGEEAKEERKSASYKDSFCSYHSDINPDAAAEGDGNTVLYAAIPWTAGTLGNGYETSSAHMYAQGYDCQDGGWNPTEHSEKREIPHEASKEEEEILKKEKGTAEERAALIERRQLEGPHQEEPNQEGQGESADYSPGLADLIINQIAEEQVNTVTDPLLNAWQDSEGHEVTDECRDVFAATAGPSGGEIGGSVTAEKYTYAGTLFNQLIGDNNYYLNNVFNFASGTCVGGVGLVARFTAPNPVNVNEIVGFDGIESAVSLFKGELFGPSGPPSTTYATFHWSFGDGTEASGFAPDAPPCEAPWLSPCAGSAFHSYQYGGKYKVKLTITDVGGNVGVVEHEVTVNGPAPPSSEPAAQGSGQATPGGAGAAAGTPAVPAPIATAAIVSRTLHNAIRKGLVVRYSVNEQVAGHFEVLLSRSEARRLGISGYPATGLPVGSPPELVIAKAILVTTKGGRNTVNILFSKRTAARLGRAHKVSLMLRLVVRNADSKSPTTTTVVSLVTLTG